VPTKRHYEKRTKPIVVPPPMLVASSVARSLAPYPEMLAYAPSAPWT
jgi:hypothetical protein